MNAYSLICRLIGEKPEEWKKILEEKRIRVKEDNGLCIMNYLPGSDFSDPVVQEARGIIIDAANADVVCWPFRKFGNWFETYADEIDWKSAVVQEKIDGSIIKLYFWNGEWRWATNSMIDAGEASAETTGKKFSDMIRAADNYADIPFSDLDKDRTYIFELVSPETMIVIEYPYTRLFHTGTRSRMTGKEYDEDIGIVKPKVFGGGKGLEEYTEYVRTLNRDGTNPEYEGFVVVDKNWNRVKIKSPEYLAMHKLINNGNMSENRIVKAVFEKDDEIREIAMRCRSNRERWENTEKGLIELEKKINCYMAYARGVYEEVLHDRKSFANAIKNDPLSHFGFAAAGNERTASELLSMMSTQDILRMLKKQEEGKI